MTSEYTKQWDAREAAEQIWDEKRYQTGHWCPNKQLVLWQCNICGCLGDESDSITGFEVVDNYCGKCGAREKDYRRHYADKEAKL